MHQQVFNITKLNDELKYLKTNGIVQTKRISLTKEELVELVNKSVEIKQTAPFGYYLYIKIDDTFYELYTRPLSDKCNITIKQKESIYQHIDRIYKSQLEQLTLF